ncbi:MAG: hypothetical protein EA351_04775 [Gemmatimonadales bacterium]|nr:MAG: hypothetical protein EA351_04775 [Gemmatimonadales bacterium]
MGKLRRPLALHPLDVLSMTGIPADWATLVLLSLAAGLSLPLLLVVPLALTLTLSLAPSDGGIALLATPAPAALGTLLLLTSLLVRGAPGVRQVWRGVLALSVLPAAVILPVIALDPDRSGWAFIAAAVLAVLLAGSTQSLRVGGELLHSWKSAPADDRTQPHRVPPRRETLAGVALAVLLVLGTWTSPWLFVIPALLLWTAGMIRLRSRLRACRFGAALVRGVARHLAGESGWRTGRVIPDWIPRPSLDGEKAPLRGAPAGWGSSESVEEFQDGWFVTGPDGPAFFYRSPLRTWEVDLVSATLRPEDTDSPLWGLRVPMTLEGNRHLLLLPRFAPAPSEDIGENGVPDSASGNPASGSHNPREPSEENGVHL